MSRWALLLLGLLAWLPAGAELAVPNLAARVTDLSGTLDAAQLAGLEARLAAFEQRKGAQLTVLIVPDTQPETIEQYAIRVADAWQLGRRGVDDGVLLLVATQSRQLRIEVGYGLEGVLPDAIARRIIDETIVPHFRTGDYHAGIKAGVGQLMAVIDGESLPAPHADDGGLISELISAVPLLLIFPLGFGATFKRGLGQLPGSAAIGALVGVLAWLVVGTLALALVAGMVAFLLTLLSRTTPGGWSSSGRAGTGGSRGSRSGGGGFRGGGGSFGGGGASGRW